MLSDLLPSILVLAAFLLGALAINRRLAQLERRRAERARRRRILRYLHTQQTAQPSNVIPLDTHSRKVQP